MAEVRVGGVYLGNFADLDPDEQTVIENQGLVNLDEITDAASLIKRGAEGAVAFFGEGGAGSSFDAVTGQPFKASNIVFEDQTGTQDPDKLGNADLEVSDNRIFDNSSIDLHLAWLEAQDLSGNFYRPPVPGNDFVVKSEGQDIVGQDVGNVRVDAIVFNTVTIKFAGQEEPKTFDRVPFVQLTNGDLFMLNQVGTGDTDGILAANGEPLEIESISVDAANIDPVSDFFTPTSAPAVCFSGDCIIETDQGGIAARDLGVGDRVLTRDHGFQEVLWVGKRWITPRELEKSSNLRPVLIRQSALGVNCPSQDLVVSRQHRIMLKTPIAVRMFDAPEVLCAAKDLLDLPGIEVVNDSQQICYVHILCENHELVMANGAWAESLYLGTEAKKALSPEALEEIAQIFPEINRSNFVLAPIRPMITGARARKLSTRMRMKMQRTA